MQSEVLAILQEMMLSIKTRRKVAVHITSAKKTSQASSDVVPDEATEADAEADVVQQANGKSNGSQQKSDISASGPQQKVQQIQDIWTFKRAQMLYPSAR